MDPILPYIATAGAALGLLLVLTGRTMAARSSGGVVGLASLAWLFGMAGGLPGAAGDVAEHVFFLIFALTAVASAVQMIRQKRPVYSALFFVLVIMSVCGALVMLEAFFIAFALVIVYAGAILITYMFVLMLAQQASDSAHAGETPEYDRSPREPFAAVMVAGLVMATVVSAAFTGLGDLPPAAGAETRVQADAALLRSLPAQVQREASQAGVSLETEDIAQGVRVDGDQVLIDGVTEAGDPTTVHLTRPGNTSHVGWMLVASFPASLELAGVILLMAMFGAVVLARREIDHAERALARSAGRVAEDSESGQDA
ncbi:MAG: NADH-quinone oxidoreductase subunit J [Phycisphaerales bacterium]|jgi:NADH-quinone oxidoreductase subunit J|nr:NADH-quinone oxidoreductase subunit J [Phycisphaerales bacterium]